jgi:hypothetical protein
MISPWTGFDEYANIPTRPPDTHTVERPLVLHLHGSYEYPESMVLTEDDYIQFLFAVAQELGQNPQHTAANVVPMAARRFLSSQNLLMLGYRAADVNFRLLVKSADSLLTNPRTLRSVSRVRVSVQLRPEASGNEGDVMGYIEKLYEHSLSFQVFWGSARDFVQELLPQIESQNRGLTARPS